MEIFGPPKKRSPCSPSPVLRSFFASNFPHFFCRYFCFVFLSSNASQVVGVLDNVVVLVDVVVDVVVLGGGGGGAAAAAPV